MMITAHDLFFDELYTVGSFLLVLLMLAAAQLYYRYFLRREKRAVPVLPKSALPPQEVKPVKVMPKPAPAPKPVKTKPVSTLPAPIMVMPEIECGNCGRYIKSPPVSKDPIQYKCEHCGALVA